MNKISHSVLEKIQKEQIQPRSKWYFLLRNFLIGIGAVIFVLMGVVACGMIFTFMEHSMLLELLWKSPRVFMKLLWLGLPLLWVGVWIGLMGLGTILARESKSGYKVCWLHWVLLIFAIQVFGGFGLNQSEIGDRIDERIARRIHRYEGAEKRGERLWRNPENGFLGGKVDTVQGDTITLTNPRGESWTVDVSAAELPEGFTIETGVPLRIMGEKTGEGQFKAKMVGPRRRGRGGRGRRRDSQKRRFNQTPPLE